MIREMYNPPAEAQKDAQNEAPKYIISPLELAEVQKQAHILKGIVYAMGRNDSEMYIIHSVENDFQQGKITFTEALNQFNKIQETKDRGDYN